MAICPILKGTLEHLEHLKLFENMFSCDTNAKVTFNCMEKAQLKIISFQHYKHWYHSQFIRQSLKGTVVNRPMPSLNYPYSSFNSQKTSYLSIYNFSLSVCLFVSNKRQNGRTDRANIFCGISGVQWRFMNYGWSNFQKFWKYTTFFF